MTSKDRKLEIFEQQSERSRKGLDTAIASSNYQLAAFNCRQGVKARLMLGLVQWRGGNDPRAALSDCVSFHKEAIQAMAYVGANNFKPTDSSIERVGFIAYLADCEWSMVELTDFKSDRLLDAVMSNSLFGPVDAASWENGMELLRQHGSPLAIETYQSYLALRNSPADLIVHSKLEGLFFKRRNDSFFSGGDQTEGGGLDNDFVVDYRLAALAKHVGLKPDSIHSWRW